MCSLFTGSSAAAVQSRLQNAEWPGLGWPSHSCAPDRALAPTTGSTDCSGSPGRSTALILRVVRFYLWVIKKKKAMILCARSKSRSSEQSTNRRSLSENMGKVCLFYSQNNRIFWLSNMADIFLRNSQVAQRFVDFFFVIALFGRWLAGQTNSISWLVLYNTTNCSLRTPYWPLPCRFT